MGFYFSVHKESRYFLNVGNIGFLYVDFCLAYVLRFLLVGPHAHQAKVNHYPLNEKNAILSVVSWKGWCFLCVAFQMK